MATTTNTGAKKIDQNEQWRNILGIHNDTVDAYDEHIAKLDESIAIVSDGNTHGAIASGQYVYVKNHGTLTEGLYTANSAISANATLSSSNVTAVSGGGLNALNSNIAQKQDILTRPLCSSDVIEYGPFQSTAGQEQPLITASTYVPAGKQFAGVQKVFFAGANDIDKAGTLTWANDGVVFAVPTLSQPNVYVKLVVLYF